MRRTLVLASCLVVACTSSRQRTPPPEAVDHATPAPADPTAVAGVGGGPGERIPEPTRETGGGERCTPGKVVSLGVTPRPRPAATAFQTTGGLAVWLGGADAAQLVVQPLTIDGAPRGTPSEISLGGSADLDGLATDAGYYAVLVRTAGDNERLGSATQTRIRLLVLDADGALVDRTSLGQGRWRDTAALRYRDGALRVIVEYTSGALALPSVDVSLEPLADPSYYDDGYWIGDPDIAVSFPVRDDGSVQFQRRIVPRDEIGAPVDLGVKQRDFNAVENGIVIVESVARPSGPRWAWNGKRYLVSTVARDDAGDGYLTQLLPIACN